jgi:hypothetical protein
VRASVIALGVSRIDVCAPSESHSAYEPFHHGHRQIHIDNGLPAGGCCANLP